MASKRQRLSSKEGVGSDAAETVQETYVASAKALGMEEVLRRVMLCTGKGHHVFIATVCTEWQEQYTVACPSLETRIASVVESVKRLRWAKKECGYELSVGTFKAATEFGDVGVCEELHRMECPWDEECCGAAVRNARYGMRILKWLRSEDLRTKKERCPWSEAGMNVEAAKRGNVEALEWLLSDEFGSPPHFSMWEGAVEAGRISVLEMLVQHPKVRAQMEAAGENSGWRYGPLWAARQGNLEVLQWLHANARELWRWNGNVCSTGAVYHAKSLLVLKWLRSEEVMCPWNKWTCPQFAKDNYVDGWDMPSVESFEEMKRWVHANGRPCECQD